jgi:hypothetical protein
MYRRNSNGVVLVVRTSTFRLTLFVRPSTPAPPEAKLTPLRNVESRPSVVVLMEWYGGGLASPRLPAEMDDVQQILIPNQSNLQLAKQSCKFSTCARARGGSLLLLI